MRGNVFDGKGNKIGEIREVPPDTGAGCVLSAITWFIIVVGAVVIWPLYLYSMVTEGGILYGIVHLTVIIINLTVRVKKAVAQKVFSFWGCFFTMIATTTLFGSIACIAVLAVTMQFTLESLLTVPFITFLLSITGGLVAAKIASSIRDSE